MMQMQPHKNTEFPLHEFYTQGLITFPAKADICFLTFVHLIQNHSVATIVNSFVIVHRLLSQRF